MKFEDRCRRLEDLCRASWRLGIAMCRIQPSVGDFHGKTLLAVAAADLLLAADACERKLGVLALSAPLRVVPLGESVEHEASLRLSLEALQNGLQTLSLRATGLAASLEPWIDLGLEDTLEALVSRTGRALEGVSDWLTGGVATEGLTVASGLTRDCPLRRRRSAAGHEPLFRPDAAALAKPELRAAYLNANAYLELASVDIVADLLYTVHDMGDPALRRLATDLARQLLDEARHAELLVRRVYSLGYAPGSAPISLHTWETYQSFDTLLERLLAQQVIQEGIGLDSAWRNVSRFKEIGEHDTADLYVQITADECNHVELGMRWARQLGGNGLEGAMRRVEQRVQALDPQPDVPVAVELRRRCGIPESWIEHDVALHGSQPVTLAGPTG